MLRPVDEVEDFPDARETMLIGINEGNTFEYYIGDLVDINISSVTVEQANVAMLNEEELTPEIREMIDNLGHVVTLTIPHALPIKSDRATVVISIIDDPYTYIPTGWGSLGYGRLYYELRDANIEKHPDKTKITCLKGQYKFDRCSPG